MGFWAPGAAVFCWLCRAISRTPPHMYAQSMIRTSGNAQASLQILMVCAYETEQAAQWGSGGTMITLVATESICLGGIDVSPRKVCLSGQCIIVAPSHCSDRCVTSALTLFPWWVAMSSLHNRQRRLEVEQNRQVSQRRKGWDLINGPS